MDTTTHVTTGISLAGLSFLDPTIASHPDLVVGVLLCTVIGSNAPDIDFLFKYKGNETYVQEHRGISHSIPAVLLLSFLLSLLVSLFYGGSFFFTLFLWTLISVIIHVLSDICNIYGTQAFRPFTKKWIALNILPIFDPVVMTLQVIGIVLWINGVQPGYTFSFVFLFILSYISLRFFMAQKVLKAVDAKKNEVYTILPSFSVFSWTVIASCENHYRLGKYKRGKVSWSKVLDKNCGDNQIIKAAMKNRFVHQLLQYSPYLHAKIVKKHDGYEVHWFDLRYQSRIDEPFVAIIQLDHKLNLVKSYVKRGLISIPERV
ncbi:metal-dependent hydrolase [Anaerobacillus alkaliphilus]|uniref:Metal-dependent hydrolase n=1 Tax=Anaerobacillus alkaliphilus TaxID=1548597 RepID=A0A4V1LG34_9BACI|nr:metal-dependent hydrolase [Anaerobacillus alkaliphilus]RXI98374.1 metal-dependent hydrolase [Anaerobacillus alkaliphilus]